MKLLIFAGAICLMAACGGKASPKPDNNTPLSNPSEAVKIQAFNDVDGIRSAISSLGYNVRKWRNDESGWICATDYKEFGTGSASGGLAGNTAFYLESELESHIQKLKFVMNVNNKKDAKEGKELYLKTVTDIFTILKIEPPQGMVKSISDFNSFESDNEIFSLDFQANRDKIDEYKLIITSK